MALFKSGKRKADDPDLPARGADREPPLEPRNARLVLRMRPSDIDAWRLAAAVEGCHVSELIRKAVNDRVTFILAHAKKTGLLR